MCRSPTSSASANGDINYGNGRVEKGTKQFMKFWQDHASYPFKSHDVWFVTEDIRWGKFEPTTDINALVGKVNREDLWREAAKQLSVAAADIPASPSRGKETFFDGKVFDPDKPAEYLKSLTIKRVEVVIPERDRRASAVPVFPSPEDPGNGPALSQKPRRSIPAAAGLPSGGGSTHHATRPRFHRQRGQRCCRQLRNISPRQ